MRAKILCPFSPGDRALSRPPACHLAAVVFAAMERISHTHHQLESARTDMAGEADLHTIACLLSARCASRGENQIMREILAIWPSAHVS